MSQKTHYESAVQDIEQEKKMVAALKRLSIGNMMSYDPDLPMENMDQQFRYQQMSEEAQIPSSIGSDSSTTSSNHSSYNTPKRSPSRRRSTLSRSSSLKKEYVEEGEVESDEFYDAEDNDHILDTNALLWVPANLHPEVNPDKFKVHVKTTVEEIMERKLSRRSSLSRKSSLSSSSVPNDESETTISQINNDANTSKDGPETTPTKDKRNSIHQPSNRFSNPSLRELTFELEKMSKRAGMDANDAVTLARTLSTSSLGYTDVEKLAMDELSASPHTSPSHSPRRNPDTNFFENNSDEDDEEEDGLFDPDSPTAKKYQQISPSAKISDHSRTSSTLHLQQALRNQFFQSQLERESQEDEEEEETIPMTKQRQGYTPQHPQGQQIPVQPHPKHQHASNAPSEHSRSAQDFALKRSRRPDYRKQSGPSQVPVSSGSSLQTSKHGKLTELRNNLNTSFGEIVPQNSSSSYSHKSATTHKSFDKRSARGSQLLFSYRNPNDPSYKNRSTDSLKAANSLPKSGSPYPSSTVPHSPVEQQFAPKYSQQNLTAKRISRIKSIQNGIDQDKSRPRQAPPIQPDANHVPSSSSSSHRFHRHHQQHQQHQQRQSSHTSTHNQYYPQLNQQRQHHRRPENGQTSPSEDIPQVDHRSRRHHRSHKNGTDPQKTLHQPYASKSAMNEKTQQLNQNLDLLRSEINEFKESLNKNEGYSPYDKPLPAIKQDSGSPSETNESDFSFELSYQDISYEDTLGIEKEVLGELGKNTHTRQAKQDNILDANRALLDEIENCSGSSDEETESPVVPPKPDTKPVDKSETKLDSRRVTSTEDQFIPIGEVAQQSHRSDYSSHDDSNLISQQENIKLQSPPKSYRHHKTEENIPSAENEHVHSLHNGNIRANNIKSLVTQLNSSVNKSESAYPSPTVSNAEVPQKIQQHNNFEKNRITDAGPVSPENPVQAYQANTSSPLESEFDHALDRNLSGDSPTRSAKSMDNGVPPIPENEVSDDSSFETSPTKLRSKKSFGVLQNNTNSVDSGINKSPTKKLKKKKSWPWLKERSLSLSSAEVNTLPPVEETIPTSPSRSVSTPETFSRKDREEEEEEEPKVKQRSTSEVKENMITKLFKKKKQTHSPGIVPSINEAKEPGLTVDYDSDTDSRKSGKKKSAGIFKKKSRAKLLDKDVKDKHAENIMTSASLNSPTSEKFRGSTEGARKDSEESMDWKKSNEDNDKENEGVYRVLKKQENGPPVEEIVVSEPDTPTKEKKSKKTKSKKSNDKTDGLTEKSRKKSSDGLKDLKTSDAKEGEEGEDTGVDNEDKPQTTLDVQEKLKKSIKRTSKANQPIVFTDSAFGFPLPPPSQSTLVMLDYRFPVHVERAIYRLSHLKLANPKRSLREQVLLSNFMYAYLNLVDHTLHLEQQMTNNEADHEDLDAENPDQDLVFASNEHMSNEEANIDGIDDSDIVPNGESIPIDLDISELENANSEIRV